MKVETMREQAITLLSLWGWEPVASRNFNSARLINRAAGEMYFTVNGVWNMAKVAPGTFHTWVPCEWARFGTWVLKHCIKLIEERDG